MGEWLPVVYLARMDVDPPALPRFEDWYEHRHGPDLLDAGFLSAQAYHCVIGSPLVCNVYEITSSEIFYTEGYRQRRTPEHDPDRPWILDHVSNRSNTAYEQVATKGVARGHEPWTPTGPHPGAIDAPAITTMRFDATGAESEVVAWMIDEVPRWPEAPGLLTVRACRQAGRPHPSNPSREPAWLVMWEWDSVLRAGQGQDAAMTSAWLSEGIGALERAAYDLSERKLSLRSNTR